jgi:phosphoglycerol transferase MdoB-like AlkP superfamily enzyme
MDKLRKAIAGTFPFLPVLFFAFAGIRIYEFIVVEVPDLGEPVEIGYCLRGLVLDLLFALVITAVFTGMQWLGGLLKIPRFQVFYGILGFVIILLNAGCMVYFLLARSPLDESIYFFSFHELQIIVGSGNHFSGGILLLIVLAAGIYTAALYGFAKINLKKRSLSILGSVLLLAFLLTPFTYFESARNHQKTVFINNRLAFFLHRSFHHFTQEAHQDVRMEQFSGLDPNFFGGEPTSAEYPLLHQFPAKSALADWLHVSPKGAPNIVFIIVESLSSDLVGENAHKTGNLLPFLDSLSQQSLYFPNFLSTCDRTYNVLPAALASVPNAPEGNMFMQVEFPHHWSLMSLLQESHYSRFFCGVELGFNNMKGFLNYNRTSYLVDNWEQKFGGFRNHWGHTDGDLMHKSWLDYDRQAEAKQRRMDVFLTISTHEPYLIPDQPKYTEIVRRKIGKIPHPTAFQQSVLEEAGKFATFVYLDQQLETYFERAKKEPGFDNTLFFIFGDHGSELCVQDNLSRFKIPLLIYSPLVKKPETFRAVSTQLDLAPTILNYLLKTYRVKLPETVPFMGREINFEKPFSSKRSLILSTVEGFKNAHLVHRDHFLFHNQLYKIRENLEIRPDNDPELLQKMIAQREMYNWMTDYMIAGNLMPEILYASFLKSEKFKKSYEDQKPEPLKTALDNPYIDIGHTLKATAGLQYLKINFECEFFLRSKTDAQKLPKLAMSLENSGAPNDSLLFWRQVDLQNLQPVQLNAWNKYTGTITVTMKDYVKLIAENRLKYYLTKQQSSSCRMRSLHTVLWTDPASGLAATN